MFNDFKTANYPNALVSPELYARHLSRMFSGDVVDGLTVTPGSGLQVVLQPGNTLVRYGTSNVASARLVSLVNTFNLTIATADASNPRIDAVVVYLDNPTLAADTPDGQGAAKALVVAGTPNASPSAPNAAAIQAAIGSSSYPYTVVANVLVNAGVSVISAGNITDTRSVVYAAASGATVQTASFETGAVATGTTIIPSDDTIPQNTEGNEYMTLSITPKSATNLLIIEVTAMVTASIAGSHTGALFQDSTANALAASSFEVGTANNRSMMNFKHKMVAGTTSPTTFKFRAGLAAAGTLTFNGSGGARRYGGVAASSIVITERKP